MAKSHAEPWGGAVVQTGWFLRGFHVPNLLRHSSRRQGRAPTARCRAESHAALKRLFGLHLIQTGLVEPEWGVYIGIGLDARLTADYDAETSFSDMDARDECDRARAFLKRICELLSANGFTAEELRTEVLGS